MPNLTQSQQKVLRYIDTASRLARSGASEAARLTSGEQYTPGQVTDIRKSKNRLQHAYRLLDGATQGLLRGNPKMWAGLRQFLRRPEREIVNAFGDLVLIDRAHGGEDRGVHQLTWRTVDAAAAAIGKAMQIGARLPQLPPSRPYSVQAVGRGVSSVARFGQSGAKILDRIYWALRTNLRQGNYEGYEHEIERMIRNLRDAERALSSQSLLKLISPEDAEMMRDAIHDGKNSYRNTNRLLKVIIRDARRFGLDYVTQAANKALQINASIVRLLMAIEKAVSK